MKRINHFRKAISRNAFLLVAGLGLVIIALSCGNEPAANEEEGTAAMEQTPVQEGAAYYQSYCTMCHGEDGKGQGTMAGKLDVPPPDLTSIAKRRNGNFPDQEIAQIIAGEKTLLAHGKGEMPDWRQTFRKSENIFDDEVVQEKIDHIVEYLKTIQG